MNLNKCYVCGKETAPGYTVHDECEKLLTMKEDLSDLWVHQDPNYGLGNFINITPTLNALSDHLGKPIPVYFSLDHVRDCFLDCPFIEILKEMPFNRAYFSSGLIDISNHIPDYVFAYRELSKRFRLNPEAPHTYVDSPDEIRIDKGDYTLFMYGSGSEDSMYLWKKTPSKESYMQYMNDKCIFTGSETDFNRVNWFNHMDHYLNNIRMSLALIRDAKLIVTNDTGLAHAAGAMNKDTVILWRTSALPKNSNPGKNTLIRMV